MILGLWLGLGVNSGVVCTEYGSNGWMDMRERESWDEWLKVCPCCLREMETVEEVVTVRGTVQHKNKQEVGAEEKSLPEVLLGNGRCKICPGQ